MPIFIILLVSVKCRLNIGGCLSHYFSLFGVNYGRFLAKRESAAVFALPLVGRFSTKMLKTYRMKQKDSGTLFVPQFRTPEPTTIPHQSNSAIDDFIPSDCKVKTSSDAYYVSAIACLCATFIFPPCILAAIYCVIKAKKGGMKWDE